MKQLYKLFLAFSFFLTALFSTAPAVAQCSCPNGDPIDSIVHTTTLSGILPFNSTVLFPKFHPDTGALSCVRMSGVVTTVLEMDLVNRDNTSRVTYEMFYTRVTSLSGPGISVSANQNRIYGPYDLGQATVDVDTAVAIGPDTLFNSSFITQQTSNTVPYTGATGTVSFVYYNNGSYLMTQGNDNFGLNVAATSQVALRLVYYWCPNMILPSAINRFSVTRRNGMVNLQWSTENESPSNKYTVEYSTDGIRFTPVNEQTAVAEGSAHYSYIFDPASGNSSSRIYFRIQHTDAKGKKRYTPVKTVSFTENGTLNALIYPNPAIRDVMVQFETPQSGNMDVELVNSAGQVLEHQALNALKTVNLKIVLRRQYKQGLYWLRVRNRETREQSVIRLGLH